MRLFCINLITSDQLQDIEVRFGIDSSDPLSDSETWNNAHPNDVAALLKQFLRELPDPLLTTQFIDAFQSCGCKYGCTRSGCKFKSNATRFQGPPFPKGGDGH